VPNLKPLVNNTELYKDFLEMIETSIKVYTRGLEQANTLVEVHRLQGSIHALRKLQQLKEQVNGSK
tara:strand:+ start:2080 stop:2277 length:198 start_codon:yes stop_codon:yes gene_type:complete